ncbi:hypothetical protein EJB05_15408 [Eragrostis curvula]|uniref:Uncharacterized protein n=1 Tax=Eragrostis curvula TaxID=38414 RepID=A0A5J9W1P8_9POAL|nr:hypothetical protein EJB05_15408 [Eragrostis curvula]
MATQKNKEAKSHKHSHQTRFEEHCSTIATVLLSTAAPRIQLRQHPLVTISNCSNQSSRYRKLAEN